MLTWIKKKLCPATRAPAHVARVYAFQGEDGKWYHHAQADNGRITWTSGESFHSHYEAERAAVDACDTLYVYCGSKPLVSKLGKE